MRGRFAVVSLALVVWTTTLSVRAQQVAPRDIWPQVTSAVREGDLDTATRKKSELLAAARTYGIRTFPSYAAGAASLASEATKDNPQLVKWADATARELDPKSPSVAFLEADRTQRTQGWGSALPLALQGFPRIFSNYRTSVLGRADMLVSAAGAVAITAIVFALALFIRYGRSMAHDFREILGKRLTGGSVSVLAFALLFLPLFVWLGPVWLLFYWLAIFFGYASPGERAGIVVLLIVVALLPIAVDAAAHWIAGVDSPVVAAAISSADQAYQPDALRRLQELIAVVPDDPMLHVLLGNLQSFEGLDDQANVHYRRAIQLRPSYAGAHVNLGNLLFLNNEFQAAMTEYEKAEQADAKLATAFYNHSVAAGETYKFDLQAQMLDRARKADPSFVERTTRNIPPQKIVMYRPSLSEAWSVSEHMASLPAARALFGNYSSFDLVQSASSPLTVGALVALLLALILYSIRRRTGFANACIKCGRTFCHRCKSARESTTYCTQCIHIYLKRDGVSLDTKRQKLEEVAEHQSGMTWRNRIFATFLPGSAQLLEGRTIVGVVGMLLFALFVVTALLVGRLGPAIGPAADVAHMVVRIVAVLLAIVLWLLLSLPVYRRRAAA